MTMKRIILPFLLCTLFTWSTAPPLHANGISFLQTSIDEGLALASAKNQKVFVHFTANWCLPCQWMEENTFQDHQLSKTLSQDYVALQLDVDDYLGFREKETYAIAALPTMLVLNTSGEILLRLERTVSAPELRRLLAELPEKGTPRPDALGAPTPGMTHLSKSPLRPVVASTSSTPPRQPTAHRTYGVEVALFSHYERAVPYVTQLERRLTDPVSIIVNDQDYERTVYRIVVGRYTDPDQADQLQSKLAQVGLKGQVKDLSEL